VGSGQAKAPEGEWKVTGIARLPEFRYDESMLNKGERSNDFDGRAQFTPVDELDIGCTN